MPTRRPASTKRRRQLPCLGQDEGVPLVVARDDDDLKVMPCHDTSSQALWTRSFNPSSGPYHSSTRWACGSGLAASAQWPSAA